MRHHRKGYMSLLTLFYTIIGLALMGMVYDMGHLLAAKLVVRHGLNLALRAAAAQIDMDALADAENPRLVIQPVPAEQAFYAYLRENLKLDPDNYPLPGSPCEGPVSVDDFLVVNEAPYVYQFGDYEEVIDGPGVTAVVSFPVKLGPWFRALKPDTGGEVVVYVHSTVAPKLVPAES
ncbi:hypothetical protein V3F56_03195 [Moorellaceae bacterium AZ2]